MATQILVVDDELITTDSLNYSLTRHGFDVQVANNGADALKLAEAYPPDVVVLDIMMPGLDGWGVLRALRARSNVPVIMLSALGEENDIVQGLELGADDYIVKPFGFRELLARIQAILRRRELDVVDTDGLLRVGPVLVNLNRRFAEIAGRPLELTPREFDLLVLLVTHAGSVLPRQKLLDEVWGEDWFGDVRTLDVHIHGLRRQLEEDPAQPTYILTARGIGYRFVGPDELESSS
jgi:two-component system response regulator RegX3